MMFHILRTTFLFFLFSNQLIAQNNASVLLGNENLQKKNFKEALANFNVALQENPANIQALSGSALAQNGLGNSQEALKMAESALSLSPKNDLANYAKGEILISSKNYTDAISSYSQAISSNNSYFQAYIGKSKAYNLMGDVKEAFKVLDNAISEFPSSAELFLARGLLNNNRERYSKALADFDKALRINENSNAFSVYYNRGIAYSYLEEFESAFSDFNKATELEPSNANAFYSRGMANYQLGNYEPSISDFLRADELNPNNPVTYYNLGMAFYKMDNIENACVYFHKSCGMKNTSACKMVIMVCSEKPSR
jgi:tetratricopeptide (TPR) repeat protein